MSPSNLDDATQVPYDVPAGLYSLITVKNQKTDASQ